MFNFCVGVHGLKSLGIKVLAGLELVNLNVYIKNKAFLTKSVTKGQTEIAL